MAAAARSEAGLQFVGAAFGADEPAFSPLVAHGVGQSLDRVLAGDDVTVQVDECVQFVEAEAAISPEQGEAGRTQRPAGEDGRLVVQRRKRQLVVLRRPPPVAPLDSWPESVA